MTVPEVDIAEIEKIEDMMTVLHDWSGVSDDTPDDTVLLECNGSEITLGGIRDAFGAMQRMRGVIAAARK